MSRAWLVVVTGLVCGAATPAQAGAWTRGFGEHFVRLGYEHYQAGEYQDSRDDAVFSAATGYVSEQATLYGEVGISPGTPVQLSLAVPLGVGLLFFDVPDAVEEGTPGVATTLRFGDARLGVQAEVWDLGIQLALAMELKVPLYFNDDVGKELPNYRDVFPLPGDGQLDLLSSLVGGWSWGSLFVEGRVGYLQRTEAFLGFTTDARFGDGLAGGGKVGVTWWGLIGMVEVDGVYALQQTPVTRQWLRASATVMWTVWRGLALDVRVAGDALSVNAPQGLSAGLGLSWRFPY